MSLTDVVKRVLVLAPHTDDGEIGAGGTISLLLEGGADVHYAVFSLCEESLDEKYPRDLLRREQLEAAASLGLPEENVLFFPFPVRKFPDHRQEILEELVKLNASHRPDLVLAPSLHDIHQDHYTVANEALRAFKKTSILGYEEPWNNLTFDNQVFVTLEERHVRAKAKAFSCYESQRERPYADEGFFLSLARCRGVQIGREYAEAFETVRWIF